MSLNDFLAETKVEEASLSRSPLPDGTYKVMVKAKEDGSSPFKVFVSEKSNARGGKVAELGLYLSPVDENLRKQHGGAYVKAGLAGILEGVSSKTGNAYQINLGTNSSSVSALLKAAGFSDGTIGVADAATGQALDLETVEARSMDNPSVKGTEVTLLRNGEIINDALYGKEFTVTIANTKYGIEAKFTQ